MKMTRLTENYVAAFGLMATVALAFFAMGISAAQAEQVKTTVVTTAEDESNSGSEKRAEMIEKIESLKSIIAAKKAALTENREEFQQEQAETREQYKAMKEEIKLDKAEFMASLEGLSEEEARAEMKAFIEKIKEVILTKKETLESNRAEFKQEQTAIRENYQGIQKDLLGNDDKVKSILSKIDELKLKLKLKLEEEAADDEAEVEDESADDAEDESEDEDEEDDSESDTDDDSTGTQTQN